MHSLKHKLLFIHIPKTGGNSLQQAIQGYMDDDITALDPSQDGMERFNIKNSFGLGKHATLREYQTKMPGQIFAPILKATIVRNPWERMVSWYFHHADPGEMFSHDRFEQICKTLATEDHYLKLDPNDGILDHIDVVLRTDNLQEDYFGLCAKFGFTAMQLPTYNRSKHQHYSRYYNPKTRELVKMRCQEIIQACNFKFEEE